MKTRMMISLLVIAMTVSVIGGATMAWFMDDEAAPGATFTAGSLEIDVTSEDDFDFDNINPGDCYHVWAEVENTGTKALLLKLDDIEAGWDESGLLIAVVDIFFADEEGDPAWDDDGNWKTSNDGNWVMVGSGDDIREYVVYYVGAPIEEGESVRLDLLVCFDGPGMDNDYQEAEFSLNGVFHAIQASNNASGDAWGIDSVYDPVDEKTSDNWVGFDIDAEEPAPEVTIVYNNHSSDWIEFRVLDQGGNPYVGTDVLQEQDGSGLGDPGVVSHDGAVWDPNTSTAGIARVTYDNIRAFFNFPHTSFSVVITIEAPAYGVTEDFTVTLTIASGASGWQDANIWAVDGHWYW